MIFEESLVVPGLLFLNRWSAVKHSILNTKFVEDYYWHNNISNYLACFEMFKKYSILTLTRESTNFWMISSSSFASLDIVIESKIALAGSFGLFWPRLWTFLELSSCEARVFEARPLRVCGNANKPKGDPRASTFIPINVTNTAMATQTGTWKWQLWWNVWLFRTTH